MVRSAGTAARSRVLRVSSPKARIPLSQRTTPPLPPARTYSAAATNSVRVEAMPRLRRTGFLWRPTSARRAKFCMLREPTWSMSA